MPDTLCFDADDTLWHNEDSFTEAHERFVQLLGLYHAKEQVEQRLYETELRNLGRYGYGVKSFALSAIEFAAREADNLTSREILEIVRIAHEMLDRPTALLEGVPEVLPQLASDRVLTLITKGDLHHQERKLRDSGLLRYFRHHAVVSEKDPETYRRVFTSWGLDPQSVVMVGNSVKSDILPVLALGGGGVLIPYKTLWRHEVAERPLEHPRYREVSSFFELPAALETLSRQT